MTLFYLRIVGICIWLLVTMGMAPSAYRYARGQFSAIGAYRALLFFNGLVVIGNLGRFLIAPQATDAFVALTALNSVVGIFALILAAQDRLQ